MDIAKIISEIDAKIASLQKARAVLLDLNLGEPDIAPRRRGRPKGSKNIVTPAKAAKKRNLSPEGRKRIAEAMKRRWAERRKEVKK